MDVQRLQCTSCGAPIAVPAGIDWLNCAYCGASLVVRRGEGYVALQLAEKVVKAVEQSSAKTASTIKEESRATRAELHKLQLRQDLTEVRTQLAGIESEIRALTRQPRLGARDRRQLTELREKQAHMEDRAKRLESALGLSPATEEVSKAAAPTKKGCGHLLLVLALFFGFVLGFGELFRAMGWSSSDSSTPVYVLAAIATIVVYGLVDRRRPTKLFSDLKE